MEKINFEDYRQPWETGPHWELKREFLDRYQDVFPIDRLLCLAQAYSNVELLQCSYPIEVMKQIQELSKPLKGRTHFKNNDSSEENNASFSGKRGLNDEGESEKKFKLIKFCSSNDSLQSNMNETLKNNINKALQNNTCNTPETFEKFSIDYLLITQSENFKLIEKLSEQVYKLFNLRKEQPTTIIDFASSLLNVKKLINYEFIYQASNNPSIKCFCKFYVGTTLISSACGMDETSAKISVANLAVKVFTNFQEMHTKYLNDVKDVKQNLCLNETSDSISSLSKNEPSSPETKSDQSVMSSLTNKTLSTIELTLLLDFAKHLRNKIKTSFPAVSIIMQIGQQMKIDPYLLFSYSEVPGSAPHEGLFLCNFSIKNIMISQCKGKGKKNAKTNAVNLGIKNLLDLLEHNEKIANNKNSGEIVEGACQSINTNCISGKNISKRVPEENNFNFEQNCLNKVGKVNHSNQSALQIKPYSFILNKRLFENSIKRQFVIFDNPLSMELNKPRGILAYSAQQCHKANLGYDVEENIDGTFRSDVVLGDVIIGTGSSYTKDGAKEEAALSAVKRLQKEVYTIKIKTANDEGYVIKRDEILNFERSKLCEAVSEDNIGRKMLKMMGWSGGGLGKEGISEPITVQDHTFKRGLGYAMNTKGIDDLANFKGKIESLLRNFSNSGSIDDLIFSADFTKAERAEIHRIALKYNLRNQSYGSGAERKLSIRRKTTIIELLNTLLKKGGSSEKYELVDMSS